VAIGDVWVDTGVAPIVSRICTSIAPITFVGIVASHNLLSASHGDVLAASVVRGDILAGNSTPAWARLAVGAAGRTLWSNGTDPSWQFTPQIMVLGASERGVNLAVTTGSHRVYLRGPGTRVWTIQGVWISAGVAPTGASIIVDVNINGTTIFTTQANRPSIAISGFVSSRVTNMDVITISEGQYFTVDIDQVGSTVTGQDLLVIIEFAVTTA
jgi:hypothetical protein